MLESTSPAPPVRDSQTPLKVALTLEPESALRADARRRGLGAEQLIAEIGFGFRASAATAALASGASWSRLTEGKGGRPRAPMRS
jgi:hypothetical protein